MYLSVKKVKPLNDYKLELTFENNEKRIFDVKPYLDTGLFKTLKDEKLFKMVKISYDTIEWPNKVDLDPEVLYEKSIVKINKLKKTSPNVV
jgi:hypothetical protein